MSKILDLYKFISSCFWGPDYESQAMSNVFSKFRLTPLIYHYDVEGVLGLGQREHRPFQWPRVSLVTWGTLQVRILIRQAKEWSYPWTNKQTNKQTCFQNSNFNNFKTILFSDYNPLELASHDQQGFFSSASTITTVLTSILMTSLAISILA